MSYSKCKICGEWHWDTVQCDPEYMVYYEEYAGDEAKIIRASHHEDAALKYAQYYNSRGDYELMNETIQVKVEKDGVIKFFEVGAEPSVDYTSKEIDKLDN